MEPWMSELLPWASGVVMGVVIGCALRAFLCRRTPVRQERENRARKLLSRAVSALPPAVRRTLGPELWPFLDENQATIDPVFTGSSHTSLCPFGEDRGPGRGCLKDAGHEGPHMLFALPRTGDDLDD